MRSSRIQGKAAFTKQHLLCGKSERKDINMKARWNEGKICIRVIGRNPWNKPYQTSPFYECIAYRTPTSQLVVHLQAQQQRNIRPDCEVWLIRCLYCCFSNCVSDAVSTPTRCLTVSRCSLVMECLHGPGTSAIVRGKLRNTSTHRHFTCNWQHHVHHHLHVSHYFYICS